MPQVICTLQNMSGSVSGVAFTRLPDDSWRSEEVSEDVADLFATIPGYQKTQEEPIPPEPEPQPTRKGKS